MLHLVFELSLPTLHRLEPCSEVIFLTNSVCGLIKNSIWQNELATLTSCYVLHDDLIMRGIEKELLLEQIEVIDYAKFVELTTQHKLIQTWN